MITLPVLTKNSETWRILLHSHRVAANTGNGSTFANVTWRSTLNKCDMKTWPQLASGNLYDLSPSISVKRGPRKTSRSQSIYRGWNLRLSLTAVWTSNNQKCSYQTDTNSVFRFISADMEGRKQSHNPLLISEDAQPGHRAARGRDGIYPDTSALKHPPTVGRHETVTERGGSFGFSCCRFRNMSK